MVTQTRDVHAPRRTPAGPDRPLDLREAADELLDEAHGLASGRSARTLTPGAGAVLKQSLLALTAGQRLQDHVAPGPTTLYLVTGTAVLTDEQHAVELVEGAWTPCPVGSHAVEAVTDTVVLITVVPTPSHATTR